MPKFPIEAIKSVNKSGRGYVRHKMDPIDANSDSESHQRDNVYSSSDVDAAEIPEPNTRNRDKSQYINMDDNLTPNFLESNKDETDFSIGRRRKSKPSITPLQMMSIQSPTLTSAEDSEGDILGYLEQTPDIVMNSSNGKGLMQFTKLSSLGKFNEWMPESLIPSSSVHLSLDRVDPVQHMHLFNSYKLTMTVEHGNFKWTINKKLTNVTALHSKLMLFKAKIKLPAATRDERQRRKSVRIQIEEVDKNTDMVDNGVADNFEGKSNTGINQKHSRQLKFPMRVAQQRIDQSCKEELAIYLKNLMLHPVFRSHQSVLEFLEISPVSFIHRLGEKMKEGYCQKRMGGYSTEGCCSGFCNLCGAKHSKRWLVLKETCMFYLSPETGEVRGVMLMDANFQVTKGSRRMGLNNGLLISNLSRTLAVKFDNEQSQKEWHSAISKAKKKYASNITHQDIRYSSFAPVRNDSYARWYVDGARYMWDAADMMERAQEEIFITDWWLSTEIYLKRPDLTGHTWKLGEVLKRAAERGVRVYVMLYKEVKLALGISSFLSKDNLARLHKNIKILRHPDHNTTHSVLYWAHHEKIIVVDQMYAFVGGIDLTFGRWDDYRHKLVDVGHAGKKTVKSREPPIDLLVDVGHGGLKSSHSPLNMKNGTGGALQHLLRGTNDLMVRPVTTSDQTSPKKISCSSQDHCNSVIDSASVKTNDTDQTYISKSDKESPKVTFSGTDDSISEYTELTSPDSDEPDRIITHQKKGKTKSSDKKQISFDENSSSNTNAKKTNLKNRILRRETKGAADRDSHGSRVGHVKRLGLDLVEEVRVKGRVVKQWTAAKIPLNLQRSSSYEGSSSDSSESSSVTDENLNQRKSIYRRHKRKKNLAAHGRSESQTSLFQAHSETLTIDDTTSVHLWVGKDYVNWINKDLVDLHEPLKDNINRHQIPRMPWHDIGLFVEGPSARDVARHFIQRWNAVKSEKAKPNKKYPYLVPKSYSPENFLTSTLTPKHKVSCQVVRSVSTWSAGVEETESSILHAYMDNIRRAKHYIYIENQFFISCADPNGPERFINNRIAHEIVERIFQAHSNKEVFRVFILMPLLPAFEGNIGTSTGIAMQYILYWNYVSMSRGKECLIEQLKAKGIKEWQNYISFCSLRGWDTLEDTLVSELIYIHSKLMIIDDRLVIAGSANINDRSMIGDRDSEVCLVIQDEEFREGVMNKKTVDCGVFAGSMRQFLFSEHLGIIDNCCSDIDVTDPISETFFHDTWQKIAQNNTQTFEEVFNCYPSDNAKTFEDLNKIRENKDFTMAILNPEDAKIKLSKIQGNLVQFPLEFLKDAELKPGMGSKESVLPTETWT